MLIQRFQTPTQTKLKLVFTGIFINAYTRRILQRLPYSVFFLSAILGLSQFLGLRMKNVLLLNSFPEICCTFEKFANFEIRF